MTILNKGKLFVISGPSGAGKSTITKEIIKRDSNLKLSISATTREPRSGEKNGREYHFFSIKQFEEKINNDEFLEYAKVHDNYYGTLKSEVNNKLNSGISVVLEIDVQGGEQIKKHFPDSVLIFIKTSTEEVLKKRLTKRNTDSEEVINKRLQNSLKELEYEKIYKYSVINEEFEKAVKEVLKIISQEEN